MIGILTLTRIDDRKVSTHITHAPTESKCIQAVWHMVLDRVIAFESDEALKCLQRATYDLANAHNEEEEDIVLTTKDEFRQLSLTKEDLKDLLDDILDNSYWYTLEIEEM